MTVENVEHLELLFSKILKKIIFSVFVGVSLRLLRT